MIARTQPGETLATAGNGNLHLSLLGGTHAACGRQCRACTAPAEVRLDDAMRVPYGIFCADHGFAALIRVEMGLAPC